MMVYYVLLGIGIVVNQLLRLRDYLRQAPPEQGAGGHDAADPPG